MDHLPVELLQSIFMLLSPCSDLPAVIQVCKHWRNVGLEVMNLRKSAIISAYRLEASLRWECLKTSIPAPTKRFGATILHRGQYVYVFGGATNMFTTFNDLWRFDLNERTWKRLVVEGNYYVAYLLSLIHFRLDSQPQSENCRNLYGSIWNTSA